MLALAFLTLRGHLPSLHAVAVAISSANAAWIGLAILFEAISNNLFAHQQRALLLPLGVRMSIPRAIGVTYARSALAISMPAGSAVSAGFAFQQYKRSGATNEQATAVMVLSGLISVVGLGALYVLGIVAVFALAPATTWHQHPALIMVFAATIAVAIAGWVTWRRLAASRPARVRREIAEIEATTIVQRALIAVRQAAAVSRTLRPRNWIIAGTFAMVNWLTDMLCLVAAAHAFGLPVGVLTIASIYLGVQLVRQIPITPGGIGLIETGLLAGLTSAGAAGAAAAAVVLTYRVLSCWVLIPLGGLAWLGLRPRSTVPALTAAPIPAVPATPMAAASVPAE